MAKKRQRPKDNEQEFDFEGFDSGESQIPGPGPRNMDDYEQDIPSPGPGRNYRPPRGIVAKDEDAAPRRRGRRPRAAQNEEYQSDNYGSDSYDSGNRGRSNSDDYGSSELGFDSFDDDYNSYDRGGDGDYGSENSNNNDEDSRSSGGRGRRPSNRNSNSSNGGGGGGYRSRGPGPGRGGNRNSNGGGNGPRGGRSSGAQGNRGGGGGRGRNSNSNSSNNGPRGRSNNSRPGGRPGGRPGSRPTSRQTRSGRGGGYRSNTGYQNRQKESFGYEGQNEDGTVELHEEVGMLEMHPNGYGFLRKSENNYSRERTDPFVPGTMIERFGLREGLMIRGMVRPGRGQTGPRVKDIMDVDGLDPEQYLEVKPFDSLTPINPEEWYNLEVGPKPLTNRVIDLLAPMGKGQRALIVAPPRSGKTVLLQHISQGIAKNHPDTKLIVLLIDERPEEVTDMRRNVDGEVVASSLDEEIESHVRLSQLVIERCKRLAEMGKDVFLLMDSITRLARAFNKWVGDSGRTMSGGVDIKAMDIPKKLFATARAFEEGGSVTIAGTALIDTDSRMDELIFQEFKGTGNMELVLDRKLAERRVWPAVDISKSGTRREELLLPESTLDAVTALRRTLTQMNPIEAMEQLTKQLGRFDSNDEFVKLISGKMMAE